jgi:hypothetical protein
MKIERPQLKTKAQPFGTHFTTKLEGANSKLVCALSAATTCIDDMVWPGDGPPVVEGPI